jgi:hypothetical protein
MIPLEIHKIIVRLFKKKNNLNFVHERELHASLLSEDETN